MDTGEVPGYEFEVPRGPHHGYRPHPESGYDPVHQFRHAPAPAPRSPVRGAGSGVLAVMRTRNWVVGLAVPVLVAIAVGIALVVVAGGSGNGGAAPSALAAGFPPARLAGSGFTGNAVPARVTLSAIGADSGTEVAAGGLSGGPALWVSTDGGTVWNRAGLAGPSGLTRAGTGQLDGVAHGPAGWLAVGTTLAAGGGPLVASSPDGQTWTAAGAVPVPGGGNAAAAAVAAGGAGYVIVGHRAAGPGAAAVAAAWYAPGLSGWHNAAVTGDGSDDQMMNAVTATARGFTAVGSAGTRPAVWRSAAGRTWQQAALPVPPGSDRAALDYVAASGAGIVAAGTEFTATGASRPFAEVSADGGATWTAVQLPVPAAGPGTGTTVTALTAAGGGFTATGTYVTAAGPEVVVWTVPDGRRAAAGAAWTAVTPEGTGLAGPGAENTITALTVDGVTLTGVGFTAAPGPQGSPGPQQPTLWQSPLRY
ncbi:MAG TPA: hypothetical protein VGD91_17710 [Trebonia sp.]